MVPLPGLCFTVNRPLFEKIVSDAMVSLRRRIVDGHKNLVTRLGITSVAIESKKGPPLRRIKEASLAVQYFRSRRLICLSHSAEETGQRVGVDLLKQFIEAIAR